MIRGKHAPWQKLGVNVLYGIYMSLLGFYGHSWWFIALAAYYIMLALMQFAVMCQEQSRQTKTAVPLMGFIGSMCLFLAVTLAGITYLSILEERGTRYHEIVMITMALHAFMKITVAICRQAACRRTNTPAEKCLHTLALADAAVSIFSLQRSMLVSFEGMQAHEIQLMNGLTGTAVYLLIAVLGINLIRGVKKYGKIEVDGSKPENCRGSHHRISNH